jgi:D-threo-aldose 1-dehydrogenase
MRHPDFLALNTRRSNSRREFLTIATAAAGMLAMPLPARAAPNAPGQNDMAKTGRAKQILKPEFQFGLGGVPLGNEFEVVTDEDAMKTLEASWDAGVRYFDVSPWYGLGLAERRYGMFLHKQPRDSYLISTKVGKLLKASPHNNSKDLFPYGNSPNNVVFDYTADGVRRSLEDSLQRLGIDHIDVVFVHDISSDNVLLPRPWLEEFAVAMKGAFPALSQMRDEGIIKAWALA